MPWLVSDAEVPRIARKSRAVLVTLFLCAPPAIFVAEVLLFVLWAQVDPHPGPLPEEWRWWAVGAFFLLPNLGTVVLATLYVGAWLRHLLVATLILVAEGAMVSGLLALADPMAGFSPLGGVVYLAMGSLPIFLVGIAMSGTISAARRELWS